MSFIKLLLAIKEDPVLAARWQTDPDKVLDDHGIDPKLRAAWRARKIRQLDQIVLSEFHNLLEALQTPKVSAILWPSTIEGNARLNTMTPSTASVGSTTITVALSLLNVQSTQYTLQGVDYTLTSSSVTLGPASAGTPTIGINPATGKPNSATFVFVRTFPSAGNYAVSLAINDPGHEDDGLTIACGTIVVS